MIDFRDEAVVLLANVVNMNRNFCRMSNQKFIFFRGCNPTFTLGVPGHPGGVLDRAHFQMFSIARVIKTADSHAL
jgi:hypothetical protein